MVMKAYLKSILRSVKNNIARFVSIIVIMTLGIAFVAGLGTLSPTIKDSFSAQMEKDSFYDIIVKCKDEKGFSQETVEKISALDIVKRVETLSCVDQMDPLDEETRTRVYVMDDFDREINTLVLEEGRYPEKMNEVLVERKSNEIPVYALNSEIKVFGIPCTVVGVIANSQIYDQFGEPYVDADTREQDGYLKKIVYFDRDFCMLPFPITDAYVQLTGFDGREFFSQEYEEKVDDAIEVLTAELGEGYEFLTVRENKSTAALDSYCDKVSVITLIFPIFFTAVSALVVMTTVTRMVEEDRHIIGCLKSLGMCDGKITLKYLILTSICCIISVSVGMVVGFAVLPTVIYPAFETMFYMPPKSENLYPLSGMIAFAAMAAVVLLVTYTVCRNSLKEKPAELLTAKAPKAGKRILLERIPFLWKPLSFKYKSSIRNIFRYKKHLIMTVLSVAGATALAFAGFAILDVAEALAEDGGSFVGMRDSIAAIAIVVIIFALLLCVFVIYNLTNLNVGERKKEIATLSVLGYHGKEVLGYIYREILMMAIVGAIVGVGLGMALIAFVLMYLDFGSLGDAKWTAYVFSFLVVMLFVVITDLLLAPKILKIEMTTSLKSND